MVDLLPVLLGEFAGVDDPRDTLAQAHKHVPHDQRHDSSAQATVIFYWYLVSIFICSGQDTLLASIYYNLISNTNEQCYYYIEEISESDEPE